jgi:hypothetical protein
VPSVAFSSTASDQYIAHHRSWHHFSRGQHFVEHLNCIFDTATPPVLAQGLDVACFGLAASLSCSHTRVRATWAYSCLGQATHTRTPITPPAPSARAPLNTCPHLPLPYAIACTLAPPARCRSRSCRSSTAREPLQRPLAYAPPLRAPALPAVPLTSLCHTRTPPACWARARLLLGHARSLRLHSCCSRQPPPLAPRSNAPQPRCRRQAKSEPVPIRPRAGHSRLLAAAAATHLHSVCASRSHSAAPGPRPNACITSYPRCVARHPLAPLHPRGVYPLLPCTCSGRLFLYSSALARAHSVPCRQFPWRPSALARPAAWSRSRHWLSRTPSIQRPAEPPFLPRY